MSFSILSLRTVNTVKIGLLAIFLALLPGYLSKTFAAQVGPAGGPEPRREQLLNGLRILLWNHPGDARVMLKLRIHSGAAFDLAGKPGMMALLGDALFPNPATHEYFTEELGGKLDVTTDYDSLTITMTGPATEFEGMVDILRNALVNTQLTADVVSRLREARVKLVGEMSASPTMIADRAIATRLFGEHPYGRPFAGSTGTLARIERADLMLARERFLNPNNATLAVTGGVDDRRVLRTLRQLLGNWRKSDSMIPTTFRQPEAPDARTLVIDQPGAETAEIRLATRGLARADRDYAVATLLALLARDRWQAALPALSKSAFFVHHEAHTLPGIFVMGASVRATEAAQTLETARSVFRSMTETQPSATELERVRAEALAVLNKQTEKPETLMDAWLDADTFKLPSITDQSGALSRVTATDVRRVAARLFRETPVASVAVGNARQLRAELGRAGQVEVLGEALPPVKKETTPDGKALITTPVGPTRTPAKHP